MVLINMDMPSSCLECPIRGLDEIGESVCKINNRSDLNFDKLPQYCPLEKVPYCIDREDEEDM